MPHARRYLLFPWGERYGWFCIVQMACLRSLVLRDPVFSCIYLLFRNFLRFIKFTAPDHVFSGKRFRRGVCNWGFINIPALGTYALVGTSLIGPPPPFCPKFTPQSGPPPFREEVSFRRFALVNKGFLEPVTESLADCRFVCLLNEKIPRGLPERIVRAREDKRPPEMSPARCFR